MNQNSAGQVWICTFFVVVVFQFFKFSSILEASLVFIITKHLVFITLMCALCHGVYCWFWSLLWLSKKKMTKKKAVSQEHLEQSVMGTEPYEDWSTQQDMTPFLGLFRGTEKLNFVGSQGNNRMLLHTSHKNLKQHSSDSILIHLHKYKFSWIHHVTRSFLWCGNHVGSAKHQFKIQRRTWSKEPTS